MQETIDYTYQDNHWTDVLTGAGSVTYENDDIGNRTGDGTWTYTWEHGRQLASMSKTGTSITYAYGADGMRIGKSVTASGVTTATEYYYRDGQLIEMISGSDRLHFFYNANGTPISVLYNNTRYYYVRNAQGDIVALTTVTGQKAVTYSYDAWGKLLQIGGGLASTLGQANPLRYRGYVYDSETGLYYLGSRYYDPGVGRFINADAFVSTGQDIIGYNMFAYCANNPINRVDPSGRFWGTVFFIVVAAVCAGTLSGCSSNGTLASAPDLDVTTAPAKTYNCYGNAIKKQILANPSGYKPGDSSRKTYNAVVNDLGKNNVRELGSINDPIEDDEYKVALRCGPDDYHFIRQDDNGWFNKSGTKPGLFIEQSSVEKEIWHPIWVEYGRVMTTNSIYYDDETIYFAVKVRWDEQ